MAQGHRERPKKRGKCKTSSKRGERNEPAQCCVRNRVGPKGEGAKVYKGNPASTLSGGKNTI